MTPISDERLQRMIHDAIDEGESDNLVSALTELQSLRAQGGVRVKPLDWGERRAIHEVNWAWDAKTSIDWYVVATASGEGCKGTFYWFVAGDTVKGWANSEEEAKAAAQADYERRILSCLDLTPSQPTTSPTVVGKLEVEAYDADDNLAFGVTGSLDDVLREIAHYTAVYDEPLRFEQIVRKPFEPAALAAREPHP